LSDEARMEDSVRRDLAMARRAQVADYYDRMQVFYDLVWSRRDVHFGVWGRGTYRRAEALRNVQRIAARGLALAPGSWVLDAGCGVGGTSVFLAEEHQLKAVGCGVSLRQLRRAQKLAERSAASDRPRFLISDYVCSAFRDGFFDGAVAIESACHATSKRDFLSEMARVLRPGGSLVVIDGFVNKLELTRDERVDLERYMRGVALPGLARVDEFRDALALAGFEDVQCTDRRRSILPSAFLIEAMCLTAVTACGPLFAMGLLPRLWLRHGLAGLSQRRLFQRGTLAYCVFIARKRG
jgi:cyclopropane fatty-acyl-phospholipid synthase-like methyltransferase